MAAIELDGVWKRYRIYRERYRSLKEIAIHRRLGEWDDHWVLRDVSLRVEPGSSLGFIGANGAGKSTSLKLMARILTPDRGRVSVSGRVSSLIELGAGFQAEYSGRENVFLNGSLLGLTRNDIQSRFDQIVDFAELGAYIDQPLRTYSSGMAMRLGFAVAISVDPEILLVDEVLAVGDESFQRKCFAWFQAFQRRGGTLVLVTHNLPAVTQMCDRAVWIADGAVMAEGEPTRVVKEYLDAIDLRAQEVDGGRTAAPPVQLDNVQLLGADDKILHTLSPGEPLVVRIGYRLNNPIEVAFAVRVARQDGVEVYGVSSATEDVRLPETPHEGRLELSFAGIPLMAGAYFVTVAALDGPRQDAAVIDDAQLRFNVVSTGGESGLVRLDHRWSLDVIADRLGRPGRTRGAAQ